MAELKDIDLNNQTLIKREIARKRKLTYLIILLRSQDLLDIEQGIKQYNLFITFFENERTGGNAPPLDVNEEMALRELSQKYISGLQKENIILDDTGRVICKRIKFSIS